MWSVFGHFGPSSHLWIILLNKNYNMDISQTPCPPSCPHGLWMTPKKKKNYERYWFDRPVFAFFIVRQDWNGLLFSTNRGGTPTTFSCNPNAQNSDKCHKCTNFYSTRQSQKHYAVTVSLASLIFLRDILWANFLNNA